MIKANEKNEDTLLRKNEELCFNCAGRCGQMTVR